MPDAPSVASELVFLDQLVHLARRHSGSLPLLRLTAYQAVADHLAGRALQESPQREALAALLADFAWSRDERDDAPGVLTPHLLETLFAATLEEEEKRIGGIVYTSRATAEAVIDAAVPLLTSPHGARDIADPAAGSGAFLVALSPRFPGARLLGIDPSVSALKVAQQRVSLCRAALGGPPQPLELVPGAAQERLLANGPYDLVIGNPPYVRHEARTAPKESVVESLAQALKCSKKDVRLRRLLTGRADLYATFFLLGLSAVRPGGVVAFVTADTWLDADFGMPLQSLLLEQCDHLEVLPESGRSFGATGVNTVITVARRRRGQNPTRVTLGRETLATPPVPGKWAARYLRGGEISRRLQRHPAMVPLGEVAHIAYGTKPGIRSFFVLPLEAAEPRVEACFVRPCLASSKEIIRYRVEAQDLRHGLFVCPHSLADLARLGYPRTAAYVQAGATMVTGTGARHTQAGTPYPRVRSIAANRPEWHCLAPRNPGQFIIPCLLGSRLFVAHNRCAAYDTNAFFHGTFGAAIDWRLGLGLLNASATYLMFETFGRPKGLGGLNLYGPELRQLPIPSPGSLDAELGKAIGQAFGHLCRRPIMPLHQEVGEGILQQVPADRRALDALVFQALGWTEADQGACYRELYLATAHRLEKGRHR